MRCQCCDKVVKHANVPTRKRRMCGDCLRSIIKILNSVPIRNNHE